MATSTAKYRFEFRLFDWAEQFSIQLCGDRRSFFIGMREDGSVRRIYFARKDDPFDGARKATLAESHPVWFLYAPYSDVGSGYVEWYELDRPTAERWLGVELDASDFQDVRSLGSRDDWPRAWRMIIG